MGNVAPRGMSETALLELRDVSVRFGFVEALKSVNLTIWPKEVVAIVGDNGAGKSTLIKIMGGLLQPDSGRIRFQDRDVAIPSVRAADRLGIASVFQGQEFCDNLDVASNLFLGKELDTFGVRDDASMNSRARQVLATLSSAIRVGSPITALSVGQRQTVAIARTLLNDPRLILLDEPTSSLSVMQTAEVLSYIKRLRAQGRSVVMVCHALPDVFAVADRIVVVRSGRITGVHRTVETSYEEIIAQIAGIAAEYDGDAAEAPWSADEGRVPGADPAYAALRRHGLIDRARAAAHGAPHAASVPGTVD